MSYNTISNYNKIDDQVIIKSVFNRGVNEGRQYVQDLIDEVNTDIIVR